MASGSEQVLQSGVASFAPECLSSLDVLKSARAIVVEHWCAVYLEDTVGNVCAIGALRRARDRQAVARRLLLNSVRRIYPRMYDPDHAGLSTYEFEPIVLVNDILGRAAVLAAFDDAILHEEMCLMLSSVDPAQPLRDLATEPSEAQPKSQTSDGTSEDDAHLLHSFVTG